MKNSKLISFMVLGFSLSGLALDGLALDGLALEKDRELPVPQGLVELQELPNVKSINLSRPLGEVDDDSWSNYVSDYCVTEKEVGLSSLIGIEAPKFCNDGTASYRQPKSSGIRGWEGKCGQTSASNIIYGLCNVALDPAESVNDYMRDLGPGVYPSTLRRGLNEIFGNFPHSCQTRGRWKWFYNKSERSFIQAMKYMTHIRPKSGGSLERLDHRGMRVQRTPLALLIRDPGSHMLHWITLVDIEEPNGKCMVVVNHWDNQYKAPCSTLAKWSKGVSESYPLIFRPYNMVVLRD
jgi:hypothetical protein